MLKLSGAEILGQQAKARAARGEHGSRLDALAAMFYPNARGFDSDYAPGQNMQRRCYDTTGQVASERLAAFLFNNTMGAYGQWFKIQFRDPAMRNDKAANEVLQAREQAMTEELQESNFKSVIPEALRSKVVFGTFGVGLDKRRDWQKGPDEFPGMVFRHLHLDSIDFIPDVNDELNYTFAELKLTPGQAIGRYGRENLPKEILDAYEKDPSKCFPFIWAIYPRYESNEDYKAHTPEVGQPEAEALPWASVHVCVENKAIVKESGFYSSPRYVGIYENAPAWPDWYGYGPGDKSYGSLRASNRTMMLEERALEKNVDPGYFVNESNQFAANLDHTPGSVSVCRDISGIRPKNEGTRWDVTFMKKEEFRQQIRDHFHLDLIALPDPGKGQMTAYEVSVRRQFMVQTMGPVAGQIEGLMDWLVRSVYLLMETNNGFINLPWPDSVGEAEIDIEFRGPLIQAQRMTSQELTAEWIQTAIMWSREAERPDILDNVNFDGALREGANAMGVNEQAVTDPDEMMADRQKRQQAEEAQQKAATLKDAAGAVDQFAGAQQKVAG